MQLRNVNTIVGKELRIYFNSPIAYLFITVFLVSTSVLFYRSLFVGDIASMRSYFSMLPWIFLFLLPALTMRLWSEELKMGTIEILLTAPVTEWEAVFGKFFASFIFLIITLLLSMSIPATLFFIGMPDWGSILCGYFGAILLGGAYLAVGLWVSSLTNSQIIAFILGSLIVFLFFIFGQPVILNSTPVFLISFFKYLGLGNHYESILRGVVDSRDLIYYLIFISLFLYLNVASLKSRKFH